MGVASMVIGIIAAILAFIPFCGMIAFVPAGIGFILGIVDVALKAKKQQPKGQGIAGIVLNAIALALILVYTVVLAAGAAATAEEFEKAGKELEKAGEQFEKDMDEATKELEKSLSE